jgi:hypothetical protein
MKVRIGIALSVMALFAVAIVAVAVDVPVPDQGGFFVYDGGKLVKLNRQFTKEKEWEKSDAERTYVGFSDKGVEWKEFSRDAVYVLNDARLDQSKANFRKLRYEGTRIVDGTETKTPKYQLNMWVRDKDVFADLNESTQKPGVWIFTPSPKFEAGRYLVFFGDSLVQARKDKTDNIFNWEIKG